MGLKEIKNLSVVVPVYNEEEALPIFLPNLIEELDKIKESRNLDYEIILINDGSTDKTYQIMKEYASKYRTIKIIHFGNNFGQTAGLAAGFNNAHGDIIVTLDADSQNDPADILALIDKLKEGYDVVSGWRKDRKDKFFSRILPSRTANSLISMITGLKLNDYGCTLKAYTKESVQHLHLYGEMHRFIPALLRWSGATIAEIPVKHHPRKIGKSKYGISRTIRVLLDLAVIKFLTSFSTRPIQFFGFIGLIIFIFGCIAFLAMLYFKFHYQLSMNRNPLLYLSLTSFMMSLQFFILGFIAEMLSRTYHETQHKPIYVIKEKINFDAQQE